MPDVSSSALLGLERIEERLAVPEPLCLALLVVERRPGGDDTIGSTATDRALLDAVATRLRELLRPYDDLRMLADGRFVITLPTLADAAALEARWTRIFDTVRQPYRVAGTEIGVRTLLGAAVRTPQERPGDFLTRVVGAVEMARAGDGRQPILL